MSELIFPRRRFLVGLVGLVAAPMVAHAADQEKPSPEVEAFCDDKRIVNGPGYIRVKQDRVWVTVRYPKQTFYFY